MRLWKLIEGDRARGEDARIVKAGDEEFIIARVVIERTNKLQQAEDLQVAKLLTAAPELRAALDGLMKSLQLMGALGHPDLRGDVAACETALRNAGK